MFLSGDQTVLWDAPLKLRVARARGIEVFHLIHSADSFSRPPRGSTKLAVTREANLPDGNLTRWTATMESAEFLGACPVDVSLLRQAGVDLKRIARFKGISVEEISEELTSSDWHGVSLPNEGRCAHSVTLGEVKDGYSRLKRTLKDNLRQAVGGKGDNSPAFGSMAEAFEEVWSLYNGDPSPNTLLSEAYAEYVRTVVGIPRVGNSVAFLASEQHVFAVLWDRFYEAIAPIYNEVVRENKMGVLTIDVAREEIPYFILTDGVRCPAQRADLSKIPEGSVLVPKALMLLLELRAKGPVLLPEKGSSYSGVASILEHRLREALPDCFPAVHPIARVHFNALDNLQGIDVRFRAPSYLQPFFGEWTTTQEIGYQWRGVVQEAEKRLARLQAQKPLEWMADEGRIGPAVLARHEQVREDLRNRKFVSDAEALMLKQEQRMREEVSYAYWASCMAGLLRVSVSLPYWNARPMWWWTHVIPGWEERIIQNAIVR